MCGTLNGVKKTPTFCTIADEKENYGKIQGGFPCAHRAGGILSGTCSSQSLGPTQKIQFSHAARWVCIRTCFSPLVSFLNGILPSYCVTCCSAVCVQYIMLRVKHRQILVVIELRDTHCHQL